MPLTVQEWHKRFILQSEWTEEARHYLYSRAGVSSAQRMLEVGCGTGVISRELTLLSGTRVMGIDFNQQFLNFAATNSLGVDYVLGDAHQLPIRNNAFSISFCHFFALWVEEPVRVLLEMKRVTEPGGRLLFLAEPDYGGRIDYPQKFSILGDWQIKALQSQGADPFMGRQLSSLLHKIGLTEIEVGVIGAQWNKTPTQESIHSEWEVIRSDLGEIDAAFEEQESLESLVNAELEAWSLGERVLYVPTFYAIGIVSK